MKFGLKVCVKVHTESEPHTKLSTTRGLTQSRKLAAVFIALALLGAAGCSSTVSAPNLGPVLSPSRALPSLESAVTATSGLVKCAALSGSAQNPAQTSTRVPSWFNISFSCLADGTEVKAGRLQGHRTVAVVWASWCQPCQRELPIISKFAQSHSQIRVIGIGWKDSPAALQDYARHAQLPFPNLYDREADIEAQWDVHAQPTLIFIADDGRITHIERAPVKSVAALSALVQDHL
jgi:thiol-disulfide isomerase/thioredoxin